MNQKYEQFHVGVKGCITRSDEVLLLEAVDYKGNAHWDFPGGRVRDNETIEQTLIRELKEEIPSIISSDIQIGRVIHVGRLLQNTGDGLPLILIFFRIKTELPVVRLSREHTGHRWVTADDVETLQKASGIRLDEEAEGKALRKLFNL
ncbi:MAG: NUDIX hydrolase [Candidatus Andersenbacteria bacterium]